MAATFEEHTRPNQSRLERWRSEIIAMREARWPFVRIAQWLLDEHGFRISPQAVHQFCQLRRISGERAKPLVTLLAATHRKPLAQSANKRSRRFEYDDSAPIDRWSKPNPTEAEPK